MTSVAVEEVCHFYEITLMKSSGLSWLGVETMWCIFFTESHCNKLTACENVGNYRDGSVCILNNKVIDCLSY